MKTYIALFRGINVGGNNILPMKDLVKIFEGMGFTDLKTYIQSGNAVFRSASLKTDKTAKEISLRISKSHGFVPKVIILEISELKKANDTNPFQTSEGKALHFFFLESQLEKPDLKALAKLKSNQKNSSSYKISSIFIHLMDLAALSWLISLRKNWVYLQQQETGTL